MKRLLQTLAQKWPEYLLEILVLTIGIYGAFALDEWNNQQNQKKSKETMVENLRQEFMANLDQIDTVLYHDRFAVSKSLQLMEIMKTKDWPNSFDSAFSGVGYLWSFDPSMGVLRSAIASGQIQYLTNQLLINYLFSWEDVVKDAKENEDRFISHHQQNMPQFLDRIQAAGYLGLYDHSIPQSVYKSNFIAVLNDPQFENFLAYKIVKINDAQAELLILRNRITEILNLIEKE